MILKIDEDARESQKSQIMISRNRNEDKHQN